MIYESKDMINEHILKITGKASLEAPIEMGKSYDLMLTGDITSVTDSDNHDGTLDRMYKFEPKTCDVVKDNGDVIGTKDKGKLSQKLRARAYIYEQEHPEQWGMYDYFVRNCIGHFDEVMGLLETLNKKL